MSARRGPRFGRWASALAACLAAAALGAVGDGAAADAPLRITSEEHRLNGRAFLWPLEHPWQDDGRGLARAEMYFDRVDVQRAPGRPGEVRFSVEELPDLGLFEAYDRIYGGRLDVAVRVRPDSGLLHVGVDAETDPARRPNAYAVRQATQDFQPQRVELAAAETGGTLKVFREAMVRRPADAPRCGDYPDRDGDRYGCLFTRERLPAQPPATTAALRAALPALTRPKESYSLVFAEEFDTPAPPPDANGCSNGMTTLDQSLWNYNENACDFHDSAGTPCVNVADGHFHMAATNSCVGERDMFLNTAGKFAFRYGYLEMKYTFLLITSPDWQNGSLVVGDAKRPFARLIGQYGIEIDSYGSLLRHVQTEVDVVEHLLGGHRKSVSHQYVNWSPFVMRADLLPRRTVKWLRFCQRRVREKGVEVGPSTGCLPGQEVTVTRGLEWTPRGYRTFLRVVGSHDELIPYPRDQVVVEYLSADVSATGEVTFADHRVDGGVYEGEEREAFFEANEDGGYLERVGVSHLPQGLFMKIFSTQPVSETVVRPKMKIDYVRVFQPDDGYLDMEPVYQ